VRRAIATLVGVALLARESGSLRGRRSVHCVRAVLDMAALGATKRNAVIRTSYARLLAAGEPKTLALTACMRQRLVILNAMAKWNVRRGDHHAIAPA
jgi:transposase